VLTSQHRVVELESEVLTSHHRVVELESEVLTSHHRVVELESEVLTSQHRVVELESEVLTSQHKVVELESIKENYDLITNSRLFRSTRTLRGLYSLILYVSSRNIDSRNKLKRLSQYLKRFPRVRSRLIQIYFTSKRYKGRNKQKVIVESSKLQMESNMIFHANRESMQRSFR
jgi:hypothetical protein